jgi:hypothetical protein
LAWTHEWQAIFNPADRVDRAIMQLVNGVLADYVAKKLAILQAEERLGIEYGTTYHPGHGWDYEDTGIRELREQIAAYVHGGGRFADVDRALDVPWPVIARALSNGRPSMLVTWSYDECDDFELDARDGVSLRELERRYGLPYKLTRSLAAMFR